MLLTLLQPGLSPLTATLSVAEAGDTLSAAASLNVNAQAALQDADDTLSAAVSLDVAAQAVLQEAGDTLSVAVSLDVEAQAALQDAGDTLSARANNGEFTINAVHANLIYELALLHGLVPGAPLLVSAGQRSAGGLVQTVSGSDTVTITTVASDVLPDDNLNTWIDALAQVHGLTAPLVVTATARSAGSLYQTISTTGTDTTVATTA